MGLKDFARDDLCTAGFDRLTAGIRVGRFRTIFRVLLFRRVGYLGRFTKDRSGLANVAAKFFPFAAAKEDGFGAGASVKRCVRLLHRLNGRFRLVRFFCGGGGALTRLLYG